MTYCIGCGIKLQSTDKNKIGYTPKDGSKYCERCFRITHYGDLTTSMRKGISSDAVIKDINNLKGLILWVVDLFDFEASIIPNLNKRIKNKNIVLVGTKRDLLPKTLGDDKLCKFIYSRLNDYDISIKDILLTSSHDKKSINTIRNYLKDTNDNNVIFMGRSNVGKSTLLNNLINDNILTTSRFPGTTLRINKITTEDITYIDTPGIEIENSVLMNIAESDLKVVIPVNRIKPKVYQLKGNQSFALGGLARIDLEGCDKASCVFYINELLPIHRCKQENADANWDKHYNEIYKPIPINNDFVEKEIFINEDKVDIVINGLGWLSLSGNINKVIVKTIKGVDVIDRKAML